MSKKQGLLIGIALGITVFSPWLPYARTAELTLTQKATPAPSLSELAAACGADASRLCSPTDFEAAMLGNFAPVKACMHRHISKVTPGCRTLVREAERN